MESEWPLEKCLQPPSENAVGGWILSFVRSFLFKADLESTLWWYHGSFFELIRNWLCLSSTGVQHFIKRCCSGDTVSVDSERRFLLYKGAAVAWVNPRLNEMIGWIDYLPSSAILSFFNPFSAPLAPPATGLDIFWSLLSKDLRNRNDGYEKEKPKIEVVSREQSKDLFL